MTLVSLYNLFEEHELSMYSKKYTYKRNLKDLDRLLNIVYEKNTNTLLTVDVVLNSK